MSYNGRSEIFGALSLEFECLDETRGLWKLSATCPVDYWPWDTTHILIRSTDLEAQEPPSSGFRLTREERASACQ